MTFEFDDQGRSRPIPFPFIEEIKRGSVNLVSGHDGINVWAVPLHHQLGHCEPNRSPSLHELRKRQSWVRRGEKEGVDGTPCKKRKRGSHLPPSGRSAGGVLVSSGVFASTSTLSVFLSLPSQGRRLPHWWWWRWVQLSPRLMAAGDSGVISMQVELVVGVVGVALLEEECGRHVEGGWSEWEVDSE
jgi:hypothetical protein